MLIANQTFPVSPSSFIYPHVPPGTPLVVVSLCPGRHLYSQYSGRHLCPGVPVCTFSLSFEVVIYIPCVPVIIFVPVVICVPVLCWWWLLIEHSLSPGHFLFECPFRHFYSLCPGVPVVICVPMSRSVISSVVKTWRKSTHNHDVNRQTHIQLIFIHIY